MPINLTGSARAVCPYYLREAPLSISCEGFAGEACLVRFASKDERQKWQECHCDVMNYARRCPYAAMMEELYS